MRLELVETDEAWVAMRAGRKSQSASYLSLLLRVSVCMSLALLLSWLLRGGAGDECAPSNKEVMRRSEGR